MEILMLLHSSGYKAVVYNSWYIHITCECFVVTTSQCTSDSTTSAVAAAVMSRDNSNRTYIHYLLRIQLELTQYG